MQSSVNVSAICQLLYISTSVHAQVLLQVPQRGCVITWDFDILKGDVTFTVFRCKTPINKDASEHAHHMGGQVVSTQYIERAMQVGPDLSIVEPPHICRDGDSVQVNILLDYAIDLYINNTQKSLYSPFIYFVLYYIYIQYAFSYLYSCICLVHFI